jgi:hypothetical protein
VLQLLDVMERLEEIDEVERVRREGVGVQIGGGVGGRRRFSVENDERPKSELNGRPYCNSTVCAFYTSSFGSRETSGISQELPRWYPDSLDPAAGIGLPVRMACAAS